MSACGEFAEHVWKPGSCKNCFHPRSAHLQAEAAGGGGGHSGTGVGGDEEDGGVSPSPYSKPTIAVRPTVMNTDTTEISTDFNMNTQQELQKSPAGLKNILDPSPFYIDSNGCSKVLRETILQSGISEKLDYSSRVFCPSSFPKNSTVSSSVFVAQRNDCCLTEKENGDSYRTPKSTYAPPRELLLHRTPSSGSCDRAAILASPVQDAPLGIASVTSAQGPGLNGVPKEPSSTASSPLATQDSRKISLSDSCSYRSSSDSLAGTDVFQPCGPGSVPTSPTSCQPSNGEPIYAESTKRKRRPHTGKPHHQANVDPDANNPTEGHRATITVVTGHTEENNRTFYLSSPDSAVSTQWPHFSPTTPDDPCTPAFSWPSSPAETNSATSAPSVQTKAHSSPPVPPKRSSRSPKLGTSSLAPLPLPELSFHGTLPPKEVGSRMPQGDVQPPGTLLSGRQKLLNASWNQRIEEEEVLEEEEAGEAECSAPADGGPSNVNGPAVLSSGVKEWSSAGTAEGGPTPGTDGNNSAIQTQPGTHVATQSEGMQNGADCGRVPADNANPNELTVSSTTASAEPKPPPPPPKKHHRVCAKLSWGSMELDRASVQGSVESLALSFRGTHITTASSDSIHTLSDSGVQDSTLRSCPSPFPSSPLASSTSSAHPESRGNATSSRSLERQPPPLPEKKLVNRTVSAPSDSGIGAAARPRPRLPFRGAELNMGRASLSEPRHLSSSSESLENGRRPPGSLGPDDSVVGWRGRGRLGGATSGSSPQLSTPAAPPLAGSTLQLHALLSNMESRECVYSKLGGLYAESLRRLALKCEEHFAGGQKDAPRYDESTWSLFKLTCNRPSCMAGDAVYYAASCASDANNAYAVKICKGQTSECKQSHLYGLSVQQSVPPHYNLQQDCGHFIARVPRSMLPGEEEDEGGHGCGGTGDSERVVVITREVPCQSAADFVREWASFHRAQPEAYERRVCFLLLQLCNGLEHLKAHGVAHRHLCLDNLLLVPARQRPQAPTTSSDPQQQRLPRLLISNFCKAKCRSGGEADKDDNPASDRARLAPEIVWASQYRKFDEFQTGILIYELLHQPNPFEAAPTLRGGRDYRAEDLPPVPPASIYSAGLQRLARLLLQPDPVKRIHIQEAKRGLHMLLWGPRRELMERQIGQSGGVSGTGAGVGDGLLNWLDVKRALLMMKFAERSLEPERTAELEDWLCCQYFSTANPLSLCHSAEMLYSIRTPR